MTAPKTSAEAMAESRKFCPIGSAESEVMSLAYLLDAFAAEAAAAAEYTIVGLRNAMATEIRVSNEKSARIAELERDLASRGNTNG